jgi:hypothetical protein
MTSSTRPTTPILICLAHLFLVLYTGLVTAQEAHAQAESRWYPLGQRVSEDLTGREQTVTRYAREFGPGIYVLRADYSRDHMTTSGQAWRVSYFTALIDCGEKFMRPARMDYYSSDGTFVRAMDMPGITLTAEMIARITTDNDWALFYNFACGIPR